MTAELPDPSSAHGSPSGSISGSAATAGGGASTAGGATGGRFRRGRRLPGHRFFASPLVLWCAFVSVHLVLGLINLTGYGFPLGDVTSVYKFWSDQALIAGYWVGIDSSWVYPVVAIVPMVLPQLVYPIAAAVSGAYGSADAGLYASSWLAQVLILDGIAFGVLTDWGRRRDRIGAGWWWTVFLLALGPIALGRIDSVTVPIAVAAGVLLGTRPAVATVLLTVAAWMKVWPGALVVALVVASRNRRVVLLAAVGTTVVVVVVALAFGSGPHVFSFVTQQTSRGLQVEAPISTIWMWLAQAGAPGTTVYYDREFLTWQVRGPGAATASALMTPLLLLVVGAVLLLAVLVVRRGASESAVLPPLVLALLTAMIAFQKVGSPQFISWLAVPVILGLLSRAAGSAGFRVPAILVLVLAALTHLMYPYLYGYLIGLFPAMLLVLTARNVLLFVLLAWAIAALVRTRAVTVEPGRGRVSGLQPGASADGWGDIDARSILGRTERRN